jgi:ABC-type nitrate/sulfonate/bicarbonate transport system substrate-binding protein
MICLATLVLSLVVFPLTVQAGSELKGVKMVIPRGSVFVLSYYGARDAGIFRKHGIDAGVDARPFAGFMAGLPSRQVLVGTYAGLNAIEQMNEDKDLVVIGGGLTSMQDVWVRKDSPIQKVTDLRGKKFGVTRLGGGTDFVVALLSKKWGFQRGKDFTVFQTGGMPQLLTAVQTGIVDAGIISPPSNLQGLKLGLKEMVDVSDLGIIFVNSPLSTTRSFIKSHRDVVLRTLRAYCEGIQQARNDKDSAIKILARNARVEDPEILQELYRIYGQRHLERIPYVKAEGLEEILSTMGKEGANAKAAEFVDNSLLKELEQQGMFR